MPSPPRIAFVIGSFDPGGATTLLLLLAEALQAQGAACRTYAIGESDAHAEDFAIRGVQREIFGRQGNLYEDRLAALLESMAEFAPTAVCAFLCASSYEVLRYVPQGIQRIGLVVADDPNVYRVAAHYASHLDMIAGNARTITEKLAAMPVFDSIHKEWFVTGVEAPAAPRAPRNTDTPLHIVTLSRIIQEQKRVHLIPEILAHLEKSGRPMRWTIIGDGPDLPWLKETLPPIAKNVKISFAGSIPLAAVDQWMADADIFLLTSDYEGLPLALVHAMMNGVVPVVSDLPSGIPELVDASTGCAVDFTDTASYARAILALDADRLLLETLSASAAARAREGYSTQAMARQWLRFLQPAVEPAPVWPARFRIAAPLIAPHRWYFNGPMRFVRRLIKSVK